MRAGASAKTARVRPRVCAVCSVAYACSAVRAVENRAVALGRRNAGSGPTTAQAVCRGGSCYGGGGSGSGGRRCRLTNRTSQALPTVLQRRDMVIDGRWLDSR